MEGSQGCCLFNHQLGKAMWLRQGAEVEVPAKTAIILPACTITHAWVEAITIVYFAVYMQLALYVLFSASIFALWAHMLTVNQMYSSSTNPWPGPVCEKIASVIGMSE